MIELDDAGEKVVFRESRGAEVSATIDDLRAVYHVWSGSEVHSNEEEFWLFDLRNATVVVSDEASEVYVLLRQWRTQIDKKKLGHEAVCAIPPASWRIKRFGFFPSTKVRFVILPACAVEQLEEWKEAGRLDIDLYTHAWSSGEGTRVPAARCR